MKVKNIIRHLIICAGIITVSVIVDYIIQDYIYINRCKIVEDNFSHVFQVDSVEQKGKELVLTGWVFELGKDSEINDFDVVLYDYNVDKEYYMETKDVVREDVNNYFLCEYDYSNSGFVAGIKLDKLELDDKNYEVLIRLRDKQKAYKSGMYISKGELMFTKPESFVSLDVEGTELEQIVNDGVLRVYSPVVGAYVYQYGKRLYWITEEGYELEEDGSTTIQYQLNTTQIDKLPQTRLENNYLWDNIGFRFEKNELIDKNVGNYRVAVASLPTEYSITKIWTGYHVEDWIWRNDFRPWYEFGQ